ncbi:hypothetical protein DFQ28_002739 [Apophysomyces sp. BC1034]|nr:hypothetical protein DFQ29_003347 [Apophysomyces sp. BC1021]KAG0193864.1 hypothetical protein DFQ28_002739 [Apophysomyces sp. BC1034]
MAISCALLYTHFEHLDLYNRLINMNLSQIRLATLIDDVRNNNIDNICIIQDPLAHQVSSRCVFWGLDSDMKFERFVLDVVRIHA